MIIVYDVTDGWENKTKVGDEGWSYKPGNYGEDRKRAVRKAEAYIQRIMKSDKESYDEQLGWIKQRYKDNPEDMPPQPPFNPRKFQIGDETKHRSMEEQNKK